MLKLCPHRRPRTRHKLKAMLMAMLLVVLLSAPTLEAVGGRSYFTDYEHYAYDTSYDEIPAPPAYEPERMINADSLGVDTLAKMTSIFVQGEKLYVTTNRAVHILNKDFELIDTLSEFTLEGETDKIKDPGGLFVDQHENIYVTEPDRNRILLFGPDLQLIRAMGKPDAVGLEPYAYEPTKLAVDRIGRMFVVSKNIYEGILELSPTGSFTRFYGTNNVSFNPAELFWRSISTEAQRQKQALWLPTNFSNVSINEDGFIFASVQDSTENQPIKLLNSKGKDILRFPKGHRPSGDYRVKGSGSSFIAIDNNADGSYMTLDTTRQRIFAYNADGYLLYVVGGAGNTETTFQNAVDVKYMGDRILVVDQLAQNIRVLKPTRYGEAINAAVHADSSDDPEGASKLWTRVSQMNPHFELAYVSMGDAAYREGRYDEAMTFYKQGKFRRGYSDAKEQVRARWIDDHIGWILAALLVLVLILTWFLIVKPNLDRRKAAIEARKKGVQL